MATKKPAQAQSVDPKINDPWALMIAGDDGIKVSHQQDTFSVAFEYSPSLVGKIAAVPEAKFDEPSRAWTVPTKSVEPLVAAIEDMRDFTRNNGVQVKDTEKGKLVVFDYDKQSSQIIGKVAGASFDKEARGWIVPPESKALVPEQEGRTSHFDYAINRMRVVKFELGNNKQNILKLAEDVALNKGAKAAIVYPVKDHSYTGPIVLANPDFVAQLTSIDPVKGVAFIAIHKQSDLGMEALQGDNLRIDYDAERKANVRTTAVFMQQQKERGELDTLAKGKMENATVLNASTKDGRAYSGRVIEVTDHFVLQHTGRNNFAIHNRDALKGVEVAKDQNLELTYKNGAGHTPEKAKQQDRSVER